MRLDRRSHRIGQQSATRRNSHGRRHAKAQGYDAVRRIRQEPWGHEVLMVATTGWGKEEDRRRSKEADFDLHLVKPIDISAVQELLASPARKRLHQSLPVA